MFDKAEQQQILNTVIQALRGSLAETFGQEIEVVVGQATAGAADTGADAVLVVAPPAGVPLRFDVRIRRSLTPSGVAALASRGFSTGQALFVPRLRADTADACRRLGIGCADADGNVFLRLGVSAIDIQGRPATMSRQLVDVAARGTRLTNRAGTQILFVLLAAPDEARNASYRELANASGASLGSVAELFKELQRRGYATENKRGRVLHRVRELLDMWVDAYRFRLFARLRIGMFATEVPGWWESGAEIVRAAGAQWGSETAIWARGGNLRPARGVVYLEDINPAFVTTLRLQRAVDAGAATAELRRRFWNLPGLSHANTVPVPLIYADLLADGDPRLVEAAAELRRTDDDLRRLAES